MEKAEADATKAARRAHVLVNMATGRSDYAPRLLEEIQGGFRSYYGLPLCVRATCDLVIWKLYYNPFFSYQLIKTLYHISPCARLIQTFCVIPGNTLSLECGTKQTKGERSGLESRECGALKPWYKVRELRPCRKKKPKKRSKKVIPTNRGPSVVVPAAPPRSRSCGANSWFLGYRNAL
jgi:hypothetical protein